MRFIDLSHAIVNLEHIDVIVKMPPDKDSEKPYWNVYSGGSEEVLCLRNPADIVILQRAIDQAEESR